jgi:glutathione S-transferase
MKLLFSGNDYIHKVLVVAHEAGVLGQLEFIVNNPVGTDEIIWGYTPLGKHPVLVLDDDLTLFSGLLACEYLDSLGQSHLFPRDETRWRALTEMALGDGLFDAVSALSIDALKPPADRVASAMMRNRRRILGALDEMEKATKRFSRETFHIGHICFADGLSFLDLRQPLQKLLIDEVDATFDWRLGRPHLHAWYDTVIGRPSLKLRPADLGIVGTEKPKPPST